MLVFFKENLVFLAVPKTGTTAYETALRGRADIIYRKRPSLKHTPARKFVRVIAPFLDSAHDLRPETMAVIREPVDQMRSWYRYRQKPALDGAPNSTKDLSFSDFIGAFLSDTPIPAAKLGTQHRFLTGKSNEVLVDHLFAYEKPTSLLAFLERRFETDLKIPVKNVSPSAVDTSLPEPLEKRLRKRLAPDIELHQDVLNSGHWRRD
jgi:hypothetical protein